MGLVQLGWRSGAMRLMGRWESETVRIYTRSAVLQSPTDLAALFARLCGAARAEVPDPPAPEPEPPAPRAEDWVMNSATGMYHLASEVENRARCGWNFARLGFRGVDAPPWHFVTCSSCAPALRNRLKAIALEAGEHVRDGIEAAEGGEAR